jgi:hypothetical protein
LMMASIFFTRAPLAYSPRNRGLAKGLPSPGCIIHRHFGKNARQHARFAGRLRSD